MTRHKISFNYNINDLITKANCMIQSTNKLSLGKKYKNETKDSGAVGKAITNFDNFKNGIIKQLFTVKSNLEAMIPNKNNYMNKLNNYKKELVDLKNSYDMTLLYKRLVNIEYTLREINTFDKIPYDDLQIKYNDLYAQLIKEKNFVQGYLDHNVISNSFYSPLIQHINSTYEKYKIFNSALKNLDGKFINSDVKPGEFLPLETCNAETGLVLRKAEEETYNAETGLVPRKAEEETYNAETGLEDSQNMDIDSQIQHWKNDPIMQSYVNGEGSLSEIIQNFQQNIANTGAYIQPLVLEDVDVNNKELALLGKPETMGFYPKLLELPGGLGSVVDADKGLSSASGGIKFSPEPSSGALLGLLGLAGFNVIRSKLRKYFKKAKSDKEKEVKFDKEKEVKFDVTSDALNTTKTKAVDVSSSCAAAVVEEKLIKKDLTLNNTKLPKKYVAENANNQFEIANKCLLFKNNYNTGLSDSEIYVVVVTGKIPEDITIDFGADSV